MLYFMYRVVPSHQTGDDVACGAYLCSEMFFSNTVFDGPSDSYWIVPGTYVDE